MKPRFLMFLSLLALSAITGCATERTYIRPIEKRQIQAGPKPKGFDSSSFGKTHYHSQQRTY